MPGGFGFSIGDFIAVGDLALKIAKALDESRGATADYKSLFEFLLSLNRALQATSAVFLRLESYGNSLFDTAPLNGMRHALGCFKRLIEDFLNASRKYTESLLNGKGRFKDEWRKTKWCLYNEDEVRKLQTKLQGHLGIFQLCTSAIIQ